MRQKRQNKMRLRKPTLINLPDKSRVSVLTDACHWHPSAAVYQHLIPMLTSHYARLSPNTDLAAVTSAPPHAGTTISRSPSQAPASHTTPGLDPSSSLFSPQPRLTVRGSTGRRQQPPLARSVTEPPSPAVPPPPPSRPSNLPPPRRPLVRPGRRRSGLAASAAFKRCRTRRGGAGRRVTAVGRLVRASFQCPAGTRGLKKCQKIESIPAAPRW